MPPPVGLAELPEAAAPSPAGQASAGGPGPAGGLATGYRPALDGVRALAVGGVILYHLGYRWLRGGFLGVDVFFVLSGYLITSLLLAELDRRGRVDLATFWARRARRLLPAVLVLVLAVALLVHWLEPVTDWSERRQDLLWTIFYGANWHQIASDQDYFAQWLTASPLRHTWSLAIEEQFYLAWPILLLIMAWRLRTSRSALLVATAVATVASAGALALAYRPGDPSSAYYGTLGRAHELLVGGLLALLLARHPSLLRPHAAAAPVALLAGLVVIVAFVAVPDSWPGFYRGGSLLFAACVAGLIWGLEAAPMGPAARLLSLGPAGWVGRLSYGLYLWHWPAVLFSAGLLIALLGSNASVLVRHTTQLNLFRLGLTFAAAALSFYLLESPVRRGRFLKIALGNRRVATAVPLAMLATAGAGVALTAVPPAQASLIKAGSYTCSTANQICLRHQATAVGRPVVALAGDSIALSLDAGLVALSQQHDWTYVAAARNGCGITERNVTPGPGDVVPTTQQRCRERLPALERDLLDQFHPDLIIAMDRWLLIDSLDDSGRRLLAGSGDHIRAVESSLDQTATNLTSGGARLVLVHNLPVGLPVACGEGILAAPAACRARPSADPLTPVYNAVIDRVAARHPGAVVAVDLSGTVCPADYCPVQMDGVVVRYDQIHFTEAGARWLAPYLYTRLEAAGFGLD